MYRFKTFLDSFQVALRAILEGRVAVASVLVRSSDHSHELVAERWDIVEEIPDPSRKPPFAHYAVMFGPNPSEEWQSKIGPGQLVAAILIEPNKPDQIRIKILQGDEAIIPKQIDFIGPGLIRAQSSPLSKFKTDTSRRESRLVGILGSSISWWRSANLVVVGAGSGGSELFRQLAANQPASLISVDPDVVKIHNLNNLPHTSLKSAKLKEKKLSSLLRHTHRNNPNITLRGLPYRIQDLRVKNYIENHERIDCIFSFVDNHQATMAAGLLAQDCRTIHIAVGTLIRKDETGVSQQIDVRLFEARRGCASCIPWMGERAIRDGLYELHRPEGALARGVPSRWNDNGRIGSSLSLNCIAAGLAVGLLQRYLNGQVTRSTWLRWLPNATGLPIIVEEPVSADPRCPFCSSATSK